MDITELDIKIGKTVIETLTQGMYQDSRFIFREYTQNSADAIDKAIENKLFESRNDGEIHINIDSEKRTIIFEDNGTGIENSRVFKVLGNIALSEKDRKKIKVFVELVDLVDLGTVKN
jgi:molecular chaperone HtpG